MTPRAVKTSRIPFLTPATDIPKSIQSYHKPINERKVTMKSVRLFCLSIAAVMLATIAQATGPRPYTEIIVFGHSGADNGNDNIISGGLVAPSPYFGRRFSNGPLWIEWLANRLGFPPPKETKYYPYPSEDGGTCFAYGGADTGYGPSDACIGVGPNKVCALNVGPQIDAFFGSGRTLDGNELIVIQAGENDASPEVAARNMGEHIATLAAAGGRVFLIPNVPRQNQFPVYRGAAQGQEVFVANFNAELTVQLDAVQAQFPNITIFRFDLLALQDDMIAFREKYGLENVTEPACPDCNAGIPAPNAADTLVMNPDKYLFWDGAHYAATAQKIIGNEAANLVLGKQ